MAVLAVPRSAHGQTDIDGKKLTTKVDVGSDDYHDSRGRMSSVESFAISRRLNDAVTIEGIANGGLYFGAGFSGGGGSLLWKPSAKTYLQINGLRNSPTPTTQLWTASIDAGALLHKSKGHGLVKAVEGGVTQTWRGYDSELGIRVTMTTARAILYLPRDWDVRLQGGVVDIVEFEEHHLTPIGGARLHVPVSRHVDVTGFAGLDSDGETEIAQRLGLSRYSYGGGAKVWLNRTTSLDAFVAKSIYAVSGFSGTTFGAHLLRRF